MRYSLLVIATLISFSTSIAQGIDMNKAFVESYIHESDSNHIEAIAILEVVYDRQSYMINARLGWLNYLAGEYSVSRDFYERAIALMPYAIEPRLGYVLPLSAMGNWDEVIDVYEEVLKIDPQHSIVNYRLGLIYYERKEYQKALLYTEKVVNLYPFDFYSVSLLGWINFRMGNMREARILFEKALLISPDAESPKEGLALLK